MLFNFLLAQFLLIINVFGQIDLKAQYCALKPNTTGEIIMPIASTSPSRAPTDFILRTQSYVLNGQPLSLSYI